MEVEKIFGHEVVVDDSLPDGAFMLEDAAVGHIQPKNVLFDTVTGQYVSVSDSIYSQVMALSAKRERTERLASGKYRANHPTKRHRSRRR